MPKPERKNLEEKTLGTRQLKIINNFFPCLIPKLKDTPDWRDERYISYPHYYLLLLVIFMFFFRLKARREISHSFNTDAFINNTNKWLGLNLETVAHGDTVNNFLCLFDSQELETIPRDLTKYLIRKRTFEHLRFLDTYYLTAIDGTGTSTFSESLSGQELVRTQKDGTHFYFQYVLEAKFIFHNGLVSSIGSEFVENEDGEFEKQDCESKAYKRLMPILKKEFPRLKLCVLLDGLYSNDPIISICEKYSWKYFITLKDGSLKTVHEDFKGLLKLSPENKLQYGDTILYWINDIDYKGHQLHIIKGVEPDEDNHGKYKTFMYITNFHITESNITEMYKTARLRWKIENEGINSQKNDFNFEHPYSKKYDVIKSLYYLLQIAHLIFLFFLYGYYGCKENVVSLFGSLKELANKIFHSFTAYNVLDIFRRIRLSIVK